jgi:hypothetical protein
MKRREFPRDVYAQIVRRAMLPTGEIACEGCGLVLGKRPYHVDHTIPDALFLDKSRKLTAADGKCLGVECCHAPKTKVDVTNIAEAKRREAKHLGHEDQGQGEDRLASQGAQASRESPAGAPKPIRKEFAAMTDLKCCPFCGEEPAHRETIERYQDDDVPGNFSCRHSIDCDTCGFGIGDEYEREAIAAWNRRALTPTGESKTESSLGSPAIVGYTNWRGEYAVRKIVPLSVWYGSTEWHPEPQWLITALDLEKHSARDFALTGFAALSVGREGAAQGQSTAYQVTAIMNGRRTRLVVADGDPYTTTNLAEAERVLAQVRKLPSAYIDARIESSRASALTVALDTSPEGMVEGRI